MKIFKVFLMVIAFILMFAICYFIDDSSVVDTISLSFFVVVNLFLGVDLAGMIKDSSKLPKGEFKSMKFYRYVIVFFMMLILFALSIYRKEVDGVNMLVSMASFGGGCMVTIGLMLTGLEGNKIASKAGNK